jgi:hypothetical protein
MKYKKQVIEVSFVVNFFHHVTLLVVTNHLTLQDMYKQVDHFHFDIHINLKVMIKDLYIYLLVNMFDEDDKELYVQGFHKSLKKNNKI